MPPEESEQRQSDDQIELADAIRMLLRTRGYRTWKIG